MYDCPEHGKNYNDMRNTELTTVGIGVGGEVVGAAVGWAVGIGVGTANTNPGNSSREIAITVICSTANPKDFRNKNK